MLNSCSGTLHPTPPFDLARSLEFLGFFPPTQNEQSLAEQTLAKAVCLRGQVIGFQVKSVGSSEAPQLAYTLWSEQPLDAPTERAAVDRLRFFLSLDDYAYNPNVCRKAASIAAIGSFPITLSIAA